MEVTESMQMSVTEINEQTQTFTEQKVKERILLL